MLKSLFACAALLFVLLLPSTATAAGSPNPSFSIVVASTTLYGEDIPVTLRTTIPAGQPYGYNLGLRLVLPRNVTYVAGSAAVEPSGSSTNATTGETTLWWENVQDLSPGSTGELPLALRYARGAGGNWEAGERVNLSGGAYLQDRARFVPHFDAQGLPVAGTSSGQTTATAATDLVPLRIRKSEPSPEAELMRGVHNHPTVYTLTVTNNTVNPTDAVSVEDFLPAGLEFLGCDDTDNTTDAATNPGSDREYPGASALDADAPLVDPECLRAHSVETVVLDPDGEGPLPLDVYTHVVWTGIGDFAAGQVRRIKYRAAIPLRENSTEFAGTTPTPASLEQVSNLDNNRGAETVDEQELTNLATVAGTYHGSEGDRNATDSHSITRIAEDVRVLKGADSETLAQGEITTWSLRITASEYRTVDDVRVVDTLPDGLCPLGTENLTRVPRSGTDGECDPVAGTEPSAPYTSVAEQADGTYRIAWDQSTAPVLAHLEPSETVTLSFPTRTRTNYQENFEDATPILSNDGVDNAVSVLGTDYIRLADGERIDHDEIDGEDDPDVSGASQSAVGPYLDKQVATPGPANPDCQTQTYIQGIAETFTAGDRVCWKLRVTFPDRLDTGVVRVGDYLPDGAEYEPGSAQVTAANTVPIVAFDDSGATAADGVLEWTVGDANGAVEPNSVFEVVFSTIVVPGVDRDGELVENLFKFASQNTPTTTFPLRDDAFFRFAASELGLTKGIRRVNSGTVNGPDVATATAAAGDAVQYRVDVANTGTRPAADIAVRDLLPAAVTCAVVTAISDGGVCDPLTNRIDWSGLTLAAGSDAAPTTRTLTYTVTLPEGVSSDQALRNTAGVRTYTSTNNLGGTTTWVPAQNVDPTLEPQANAPVAVDNATVTTPKTVELKTRVTEVNEGGNSAASQATIGEEVTFTVTTTIRAGTTLYGSPKVTDVVDARFEVLPATLTATLNRGDGTGTNPLPVAGLSAAFTGQTLTATFPASYANPGGSGDDVLVLTFRGRVRDAANVTRGTSIPNAARIDWQLADTTARNATSTISTTVVEPSITVTKDEDDSDDRVSPGQVVRWTLTARNASTTNVSTAHDLVLVDTMPADLIPVDGSGVAVADGGTVAPDSGVWNSTARTITWTIASIAPNGSAVRRFDARVADERTGGADIVNAAALTATSLGDGPDDDGGERTTYRATTTDTVRVAGATVTKATTPTTGTPGSRHEATVRVTIPAEVALFDQSIVDVLPRELALEELLDATCVSGCPPAVTITPLAPGVSVTAGTTTLAWWLGDVAAADGPRVIELRYAVRVRAVRAGTAAGNTPVTAGATATNRVETRWNVTDKVSGTPTTAPAGDRTSAPAQTTIAVTEPALTLDKDVSGDPDDDDRRTTEFGDTYTYSITVRNTGGSAAYDVEIADEPAPALTNVVPTVGAAFVTDGWTPADRDLRWLVPGPIAPGDSVTVTYTAALDATGLADGATVPNTADVTRFFGLPSDRRTPAGADARTYTDVAADDVLLTLRLPRLELSKTPDSGDVVAGTTVPFTVVVRNTGSAIARDLVIDDVLPAGPLPAGHRHGEPRNRLLRGLGRRARHPLGHRVARLGCHRHGDGSRGRARVRRPGHDARQPRGGHQPRASDAGGRHRPGDGPRARRRLGHQERRARPGLQRHGAQLRPDGAQRRAVRRP